MRSLSRGCDYPLLPLLQGVEGSRNQSQHTLDARGPCAEQALRECHSDPGRALALTRALPLSAKVLSQNFGEGGVLVGWLVVFWFGFLFSPFSCLQVFCIYGRKEGWGSFSPGGGAPLFPHCPLRANSLGSEARPKGLCGK